MNRFFTNKKLIGLLIGVIVFISLITLSLNSSASGPIQGFGNDVTAFFGQAFSKPMNAITTAFDSVEDIENSFEENQALRRQVDQVYEKDAEINNLREENEQLKEELNLDESLSDYTTLSANVISRNPDRWVDNLIIDVGSSDGISQNMAVMSQNGLLGVITEVNQASSKVTLITNIEATSNRVSAQIVSDEAEDEAIYGVVSDYLVDDNELLMTQITSDEGIEEGDLVTTSGLGGLFPSGLVIGRVTEVALDNQGLGHIVHIEPETNFNTTKFVTVIDRQAESIFPEDEADQGNPEDEEDPDNLEDDVDQDNPEEADPDQAQESEEG